MAKALARCGFDLDLLFGESKEKEFLRAIGDSHIECKSDQKCKITGNVFIETHQQDKNGDYVSSGINTSKSGWWAIEIEDERWILLRRLELKRLALNAKSVNGGDRKEFRGKLVPVEWLIRKFRLV